MATPAGACSLNDIQTEFGGSAPISLSEYYYGIAAQVPNTVPAKFNQSGAQNSISISQLRNLSKVITFPATSQSPNYDFYLGGPYGTGNPMRFSYSRTGAGPLSYSLTFYNNYCGTTPTFTGTVTPTTTTSNGAICETFTAGQFSWRKGCCNGNDNNIYVTVQISLNSAGGITASWVSTSTDGQWGC